MANKITDLKARTIKRVNKLLGVVKREDKERQREEQRTKADGAHKCQTNAIIVGQVNG